MTATRMRVIWTAYAMTCEFRGLEAEATRGYAIADALELV